MSRRKSRKYKLSRKLGVSVWGRAKDPANKRNYAPGQHGAANKKRSDFGRQLLAKQTLRDYYGNLTEKKFRSVYKEAARRKGDTGENLIGILESMLLSVVYRANLAKTVFQARQLISHGHIAVDGRRVTIATYNVKPGQAVTVVDKSKQAPMILDAVSVKERSVPEYVEFNESSLSVKYLRVPTLGDVPYPIKMEPHLVVEFYSR